jgi:hypothetical protein
MPVTDASDGGDASDASDAHETGPIYACTPGDFTVPPRPGHDDPGDAIAPARITLAIDYANFGTGPDPEAGIGIDPGIDLDCVNTCFEDSGPSSCTPPDPTKPPCDDPGGRDIRANYLLVRLMGVEDALTAPYINRDIQAGKYGVVLRIQGYTGGPNQSIIPVVAELFPSPGTVDAMGNPSPALHDGNDIWEFTSQAGSVSAGYSAFRDNNAYVANGVLVFHIPKFPLLLRPDVGGNANPVVFNLTDLVGEVTLTQGADGQWRGTNGNIAGRWSANEALLGVSTLEDSFFGGSICGTDPLFAMYKSFVCPNLDIAASASNDGKGVPCNAMSFGFGFTAGPAQLATLPEDPPVVPPDCPDGWAPTCDSD